MDYEYLKQLVNQNIGEVVFKWEDYESVFNQLDKVINK